MIGNALYPPRIQFSTYPIVFGLFSKETGLRLMPGSLLNLHLCPSVPLPLLYSRVVFPGKEHDPPGPAGGLGETYLR